MTLDQLITLLTAMRTNENKNASVFIKAVDDQNNKFGQLPIVKSVLDKKYHIELTDYQITNTNGEFQ